MLNNYPEKADNKFGRSISVSSSSLLNEWNQRLYGNSILKPTRINNSNDVILNPLNDDI